MQDPYDDSITSGLRANLSEQAKHDSRFPDHPLSRLRRQMRQIDDKLAIGMLTK